MRWLAKLLIQMAIHLKHKNLIDSNTFKTIQNEPSLGIVVPANKPKEFIRAIE